MISQDDIPRLMGTDVYGPDGSKIGSAHQIYLDDATQQPEWVCVRTGLFGTKESFVPLNGANFAGDRIEVQFDKARIKDAPRIDADGSLTPEEEDQLYAYYDVTPVGSDLFDEDDAAGTGHAASTGYAAGREAAGNDSSGPSTDDAMTRSEERLVTGTRREAVGRARLRKYIVTEQQQITVPVSREEIRLEREPITEGNLGAAMDGPSISDEEHEVILHAERPVVATEAVPVERVRISKETVSDEETVRGEVRKEAIEFDDATTVEDRNRR